MNDWAEFRHFKYLAAILELQSFRAAAEQLRTAQSNLSFQAKQFQEYSSVRLYDKGKDGRIKPTDAGIAFQQIAKSLLDHREEAFAALAAIARDDVKTLRFGCSPLVDQKLFQDFCQLHKEFLPGCTIRPERDDTQLLIDDIVRGTLDAAIVTLPISDEALHVEEVRRDRLVVCMRSDAPLAGKSALSPADLQENLTILYHPHRHSRAHARLIELLNELGVQLSDYSRASHPHEMQTLVKDGYGVALVREGTPLSQELTTRPVAGVQWTVDTAVVYRKIHHPSTLPLVVRRFRQMMSDNGSRPPNRRRKSHSLASKDSSLQLSLLP